MSETLNFEQHIEQRLEVQLSNNEQPTVEEWLSYLEAGNAVKVPLKTDNYSNPYYVWYDDSDEEEPVVVGRGYTSHTRHEEGELYLRTMLGYYDPQPVEESEIPC